MALKSLIRPSKVRPGLIRPFFRCYILLLSYRGGRASWDGGGERGQIARSPKNREGAEARNQHCSVRLTQPSQRAAGVTNLPFPRSLVELAGSRCGLLHNSSLCREGSLKDQGRCCKALAAPGNVQSHLGPKNIDKKRP